MNKKPLLLRTIFVVGLTAVFALSMYPLAQQDFLKVFKSRLVTPTIGEKNIKEYYDSNPDKFKENGNVLPLDKVSDKIKAEIIAAKEKSIQEVLSLAQGKMSKDKSLFSSVAVDDAARDLNVDLTEYVKLKNATSNRDVISDIRNQSGGSIRLGIDLNGGAEFILGFDPVEKTEEEGAKNVKAKSFDQYRDIAIETLRNRLGNEKIYEAEISPLGGQYVSMKVPIVSKDEKLKLKRLIEMSAKLQFALVSRDNDRLVAEYEKDPKNFKCPGDLRRMESIDLRPGEKPRKLIYFVKRKPEMDGSDVETAGVAADQYGQRYISLSFNSRGATRFGEVTRENVGRQLGIILDGTLYSAPNIREAIEGGNAQISGNFAAEEAQQISTALVSGNLPFKINVQAVFDTDPTLGLEEVRTGMRSGIIALVATILFMIFYYRRAGISATVALLVNVVLILGSLAAFEATLTLPGIAGLILTIGMAVDANVLINERIREELANNKTLSVAIDNAFDRVFMTILDTHSTTLMSGLILMWQGTGPLKGFAVVLTIGVITSMFTAIVISRLVFDYEGRYLKVRTMKMMQIFHNPNYNILKYRYIAVGFSVFITIVSIVGIIYEHGALSIDFTGGTRVTFNYSKRISDTDILSTLTSAGLPVSKVSYKANMIGQDENKKLEIVLRSKDISESKGDMTPKSRITEILNKKFEGIDLRGGEEVSLGQLIGLQFAKTASFALFLAIIGMICYIAVRFEFSYAIAGIIALIHDIIVAAGVYVICRGEISLNVVAALLTIIGYSINDTIIVFDRIRENLKLEKNKSYNDIINMSINQTLSRTILSSGTVLLVIVIMLAMSGIAIRDFLWVLLIGVVTGTYSSIYIASPIISIWHKKSAADKI